MEKKGHLIAIVSCFVLLLFVPIIKNEKRNSARSISSVNGPLCSDSLKLILNKETNLDKIIKKPMGFVWSEFAKYSLNFRFFLMRTLFLGANSSDLNHRKYAQFLNSAFEKKIIGLEERDQLLDQLQEQGFRKFVLEDDIVRANVDDLLSTREMRDEIRNVLKDKVAERESRDVLMKTIRDYELTQGEGVVLLDLLKRSQDESDVEDYVTYIIYLKGQRVKDYEKALGAMVELGDTTSSNKFIKEFYRYKNKVTKAEKKFYSKHRSKLKKENPGWSEEKLKGQLDIATKTYGLTYKKLYYSCKARKQNVDRLATNRLLLRSMLAFEVFSNVGSYVFAHRHDEKDSVYWQRLAFDLGVALPWVVMRSSVASAPTITLKAGIATDYILGSIADIFPTLIIYQKQFGVKEADIEKKLKEVMRSEEVQNYIKRTLVLVEKDQDIAFKNEFISFLNEGEVSSEYKIDDIEEAQRELNELIAYEIYLSRRGEWPFFETGSVGGDVFVYNKLWGTQSSIRNVALAYWMYHILCTGKLEPRKALMLTFALYSINRTFNSFGYQYLRKGFTGQ